MAHDLEFIQAISPLFAHIRDDLSGKLKSPLGATAYYVLSINYFPTTFKNLFANARKSMGEITRGKLQSGRQDLLELGFIAQILPAQLPVQNLTNDFNREMFLPISPEFVWKDNYKKLDNIISPKGISEKFELVKKLQDVYVINFGKYGVKIEEGNITVLTSSRWLLYFIAYNQKDNRTIRMLLGTLRSFEGPYIKYYENMLKSGLKTRIICDPITDEAKQSVKNIISLKKNYPENIEIISNPISYGTSRRLILDNMAIDGRKLVDPKSNVSAYISTIYFDTEIIELMKKNFDDAWEINRHIEQDNLLD